MNQENSELSKLLSLDQLYLFYKRIGESINNDIDLANSEFDPVSRDNSMVLLKKCGLIAEEDELYLKAKYFDNIDSFSSELLKSIRIIYAYELSDILSKEKKYDEDRNLFYIYRNRIVLQNAGLLMLLNDLAFVQILSNKVYIFDEEIIKKNSPTSSTGKSRRIISLVELEHELSIRKEYGELGERKAFDFEIKLLQERNIQGSPKLISDVDVSAGYDMVSFLNPESKSYDKFIEVKSCQDMNQQFYLSSNELRVAKEKGDSYFIYIYVREKDEIVVIRNPYQRIFLSEEWAKEPQIYRIHRIIGGDLI